MYKPEARNFNKNKEPYPSYSSRFNRKKMDKAAKTVLIVKKA
jgi:hypothetical protein